MTRLREVCRSIRSKNAGPFWVTVDMFFKDATTYKRYHESSTLSVAALASAFGVDAALVKRFPIDDLCALKVSYPRSTPQGGIVERDMHCGQQYVRLLDIELD
jgi:hypothetical protein